MSGFIFANNVNTTLSQAASSTATTLYLASSTNLPTLAEGEIMPLTLNDAATGQIYEIVYVTAISGTTLTVERGMEGTTANNWSVGDYAFCDFTAESTPQAALFLHTPTASESITPSALNTVVQPNITSAATITIEPGTVVGQRVRVYGGAYAVTVQTNVTTGSPSFVTPDESVYYSWTISESDYSQYIDNVWNGETWLSATNGQTIVAAAVQSNAAVQLGQVASIEPYQINYAGGTAASTTYGQTITFTAPSDGWVVANCIFSTDSMTPIGGSDGYTVTESISANGTAFVSGSVVDTNIFYQTGYIAVETGEQINITAQYVVGADAIPNPLILHGLVYFLPNP